MLKPVLSLIAALAICGMSSPALAGTAMQKALAEGAERMTAEQISLRLADKTVTFENANTGARALVYYDGRNGTKLKLLDSGKMLDGFYATDLADHICVGVYGDEPMRLRCVHVLLIDGVMHKFELDGSLRGRILEEAGGNLI